VEKHKKFPVPPPYPQTDSLRQVAVSLRLDDLHYISIHLCQLSALCYHHRTISLSSSWYPSTDFRQNFR